MIKSIEILGMGEVMFYGVNLNLETITGIIDANGNVSYTTKKPDFKVFYYVPLNKEIIG
ncbi:MAG: hypothetical protein IJX26_03280 [Clostridia bacterium]|nr:hypothetical protein [Clostridia bacterium]